MAITTENQGQIQAPNDLTEVAQPSTTAPNDLTEVTQSDVAAPNNLTEVAQPSVSTPVTLPKVSQTAVSAPNNLTEVAQPAIVAPTAITALAQPPINRPTPPLTLDLQFSKGNYQINGVRGALTDLITFNRSTTATYVGRTQNQWGGWEYSLKTAAIDEPRLSYDPATGESLGLLIEGASTNLLTYSEQFDNVAWNKEGVSVVADSASAPDGSLTMDKLVEDSVLGLHRSFQVAEAANGDVTYSAFVKANGRTEITMLANLTGGSSSSSTVFDLSAGAISSGADGASIQSFGGGVFRVSKKYTATGGQIVPIINMSLGGLISYQGDGTSGIYIWGAQLEQKPYATSYIKTEASQVTRAADLASVDDLSGWYNQSEGSVFVDAQWVGGTDKDASNRVCVAIGGATDLLIYNINNHVGAYSFLDGLGVNDNFSTSEFVKVALTYGSGCRIVTTNGDDHNPAMVVGTGMGILYIGNRASATHLDGHIKTISYFPAPLSQSEMELITL